MQTGIKNKDDLAKVDRFCPANFQPRRQAGHGFAHPAMRASKRALRWRRSDALNATVHCAGLSAAYKLRCRLQLCARGGDARGAADQIGGVFVALADEIAVVLEQLLLN